VTASATRSFNAGALLFFLEPFYIRSCEDHVRQPKTHSGSCETQMTIPSRTLTAISSLSRRLDDDHTGLKATQTASLHYMATMRLETRKLERYVLRLDSTKVQSTTTPERSQIDCFAGKASSTSPKESDHNDK